MEASFIKHDLEFKTASGTSRGVLTHKETYLIIIKDGGKVGIGECGLLRGLSYDDRPDYEEMVKWACQNISLGADALWNALLEWPSIQFGVETAFKSLQARNSWELFPSDFTDGKKSIQINGLVWMGSKEKMLQQVADKISEGFNCVKLKIGAIDFDQELSILQHIRQHYSAKDIEIRVDANGGFSSNEALCKIKELSGFQIHSIEQPIAAKQYDKMAELCKITPIPIALDEELIGITKLEDKNQLIDKIRPQYIILKPSLVGGFRGATEWISIAEEYNIGWWNTSALESNIGLNAIAQWTFTLKSSMPQGLGTGGLYTNNFDSPLTVKNGNLHYDREKLWKFPFT